LHLQRPVGPALVDRIVGIRAQILGNAETLAFILAHADRDHVVGAWRAGIVAIDDQLVDVRIRDGDGGDRLGQGGGGGEGEADKGRGGEAFHLESDPLGKLDRDPAAGANEAG
jgi:hypothetical protein